jgi:hypothetical protein
MADVDNYNDHESLIIKCCKLWHYYCGFMDCVRTGFDYYKLFTEVGVIMLSLHNLNKKERNQKILYCLSVCMFHV